VITDSDHRPSLTTAINNRILRENPVLRIRVLSDLHLEFAALEPTAVDCDLVVLAGDIHQGIAGLDWARRTFPLIPIVYVAGNHEYYGHDWHRLPAQLAQAARERDIHLLDRGAVTIGGVRFLGCTLWTDFDLFGEDRRAASMAAVGKTLFDYRHIAMEGAPIGPALTRERHLDERRWLEAELTAAAAGRWRATVVVTHMVPTQRSTAERYKTQVVSAGFASHLDHLVGKADIWIHGHTHDSYDYRLDKCRVICNPRGYQHAHKRFENRGFRDDLVVQI
jgi:predicted phosphodiesterase